MQKKVTQIALFLMLSVFFNSALMAQTTIILEEDFESGNLPTGWVNEHINGDVFEWHVAFGEDYAYNQEISPHSGDCNLVNKCFSHVNENRVILPAMDLSSYTSVSLKFWFINRLYIDVINDLHVLYRTNNSEEWTTLVKYEEAHEEWTEVNIDLPNLSATYQLAFHSVGRWGRSICIDDMLIEGVGGTETYELYLAGTQVNEDNAANLSEIEGVDGTVSYDNATKTLTLNNASITASDSENGIHNKGIENLKIILTNSNTINSNYACVKTSVPTEISGTGSLTATASGTMGILVFGPLTIKDCTVETYGTKWGIAGFNGLSDEHLTIDQATVKAQGGNTEDDGSIADIASLTLNKCAITAPAGAVFSSEKKAVVDAGGNIITEQVVIEPVTGIQEVKNMLDIAIYPNPANEHITINIEKQNTEKQTLLIYDTLGKLVLSQNINSNTIRVNLKHLKSGIYMIKIGENVKRFMKN